MISSTMRNVTVSVEKETHKKLKTASQLKNCSISELLRKLITKHLDLVASDKDEITVLLKIPSNITESKEELEKWLNCKTQTILKALYKS